jgi:hypothetical protein
MRTTIRNGKTELSHSAIFYNATVLAILSKGIAIIDSDTAVKSIADSDTPAESIVVEGIADSDSDTSKVSPNLSLSTAIIDINNTVER